MLFALAHSEDLLLTVSAKPFGRVLLSFVSSPVLGLTVVGPTLGY